MADLYHFNPQTGAVGVCRARQICPFGTDEVHHPNEASARLAFEATQEQLLMPKPLRKSKPVKIYRIGALEPPVAHGLGDLRETEAFLDSYAPDGRQLRAGALFASPDLASHGRWVRGSKEAPSHELTVNPDEVYIYPIDTYEAASSWHGMGSKEKAEAAAQEYWDSGMTLTQWNEWSATTSLLRGSWEILLPPSAILGNREMSNRRIIENASPEDAAEINWKLERRRASRGLIWRKDKSGEEA